MANHDRQSMIRWLWFANVITLWSQGSSGNLNMKYKFKEEMRPSWGTNKHKKSWKSTNSFHRFVIMAESRRARFCQRIVLEMPGTTQRIGIGGKIDLFHWKHSCLSRLTSSFSHPGLKSDFVQLGSDIFIVYSSCNCKLFSFSSLAETGVGQLVQIQAILVEIGVKTTLIYNE